MNFNEYYREEQPLEVPSTSLGIAGPRLILKKDNYLSVIRTIVGASVFRVAIPAHHARQYLIEHKDFWRTFDFTTCSRICDAHYEFSSTHRDVVIFICGAFAITSLLYVVRIYLTVGNLSNKETNGRSLASYANAFVIAFIPIISMSAVLWGNLGGTCVDGFG